jgi:hypothetical protein
VDSEDAGRIAYEVLDPERDATGAVVGNRGLPSRAKAMAIIVASPPVVMERTSGDCTNWNFPQG